MHAWTVSQYSSYYEKTANLLHKSLIIYLPKPDKGLNVADKCSKCQIRYPFVSINS